MKNDIIRLGDFKSTSEQRKIVNEILNSGRITEGKYVRKLEREIEKYLKVKHAIAVTNGTVALQLVAHYLKGGRKEPVACVPATTFPATLNAFLLTGYKIMLCDIEEKTLCMDISTLTTVQKRKIDVLVPVHLLGFPANMDKIIKEARKYNWVVVEDFAESFGSDYKERK